jgi:RNA polymerase sigma factor (sigma-70 family)
VTPARFASSWGATTRAHAVAYGVVRNAEDAQEVTQDAFMRVYRHLNDFEGQASFSTWLYRIVVNLSIDAHPPALARQAPSSSTSAPTSTAPPDEHLPYRGDRDPFAPRPRRASLTRCKVPRPAPPYHRTDHRAARG